MALTLRLKIKPKYRRASESVIDVDLHPDEPWILACLNSGTVQIYDYVSRTKPNFLKVVGSPVRSGKFISRKQWVIVGGNDKYIRVYDYSTSDDIKTFSAHQDCIRCVAVHSTRPFVLSCSDDMLIKLWNWENDWACCQIFEGHAGPVVQVAFNPYADNFFASASNDCTAKIWSIDSANSIFNLDGHLDGVTCVVYFVADNVQHLITCSNDRSLKFWNGETKHCLKTLSVEQNVTSACMHPELPILITCTQDGIICLRNCNTYCLEGYFSVCHGGTGQLRAVGCVEGSRRIVYGHNGGMGVLSINLDKPIASIDNTGKIIWAKNDKIQICKAESSVGLIENSGGKMLLTVQHFATCDFDLKSLKYSPNGKRVLVSGEDKFILSSSNNWKKLSSGNALEAVWSSGAFYAVKDSESQITIYDGNSKRTFITRIRAGRIYGGTLLAVCSRDSICFHDWGEGLLVFQTNVSAKNICWSDGTDMVAIATDLSVCILKYNRDIVSSHISGVQRTDGQGIEDSFEIKYKIGERIRSGVWFDDCFIYNNWSFALKYCIDAEVTSLSVLDRPMYILGYLSELSKIILIDKEYSVFEYHLPLSILKYKSLVVNGDLEGAKDTLRLIPVDKHDSIAKFLEARGLDEEALRVATSTGYRFVIAIKLKKFSIALDMVNAAPALSRWKMLAEAAVANNMVRLGDDDSLKEVASCYDCYKKSNCDGSFLEYLQSKGKTGEVNGVLESSLELRKSVEGKLFGEETMERDDVLLLSRLSGYRDVYRLKLPPSKLTAFAVEQLVKELPLDEELLRFKVQRLKSEAQQLAEAADNEDPKTMLLRTVFVRKRRRRGGGA